MTPHKQDLKTTTRISDLSNQDKLLANVLLKVVKRRCIKAERTQFYALILSISLLKDVNKIDCY